MLKNVKTHINPTNSLIYLNSDGKWFYLLNMVRCPNCNKPLSADYYDQYISDSFEKDKFIIDCPCGLGFTSKSEDVIARIRELNKEKGEFEHSIRLPFLFDRTLMNDEYRYYAECYEECLKHNASSFNEEGIVYVNDVFLELFTSRNDAYTIRNIHYMKDKGYTKEMIKDKLIHSFYSRQKMIKKYSEEEY